MFRKIIPYCLVLLVCFSSLGYAEGYTPKVGEVLEYKVIVQSAIHGANETIKVVSKDTYNGRDVYNIHSQMGTVGLAKGFYNYDQVEDLVLDAEGLYPWLIKLEITENKNIQHEEIYFDYPSQKAVRLVTKNGGALVRSEINLPGFIQDALSLQFFLRKDQVVNSVNKIYYYEKGSITETTYTVKQVWQPIQLDCGTYSKCLQIVDGVSKITILITDTLERLPISIRSIASFGAIEMKLAKIKQGAQ